MVLFSANVDDIRKIARKFVSQSLVENIADMIDKVGRDRNINVSEGNEKNSELRGGFKTRIFDNMKNETPKKYNVKKQYNTETLNMDDIQSNLKTMWQKPDITPIFHITDIIYDFLRAQNRTGESATSKATTSNSSKKRKAPRNKLHKEKEKLRNKTQHPYRTVMADYTVLDDVDQSQSNTIPNDSSETTEKDNLKANDDTVPLINTDGESIVNANSLIGREGAELTTEKVREEFDQYDYTTYPKSILLATSGDIFLREQLESQYNDGDNNEHKLNDENLTRKHNKRTF
ncbi:hypothetical protein ACJJTC_018555 [Scirpophaga incertulas]